MSTPYIGEVRLWALTYNPKGWAYCNGQTLPVAQNQALFSLLGTYYGGNGTTTFNLPDLRGRTPWGAVNGTGMGAIAGAESVALNTTQIPPHIHTLNGTTASANSRQATGYFAADTSGTTDFYSTVANLVPISPAAVGLAGNGQPHGNMQPYLVLNYCIALQGLFPSRN